MTTAAERLQLLAGTAGTAATLLLLIGSGATAGAALVNYSQLPTATAATHLLADVQHEVIGSAWLPAPERDTPRRQRRRDEEALLLAVLL